MTLAQAAIICHLSCVMDSQPVPSLKLLSTPAAIAVTPNISKPKISSTSTSSPRGLQGSVFATSCDWEVCSFSIATTTNYYEFGSLKQHPLSRSPACGPEVWYYMAASSAQGVTRLRSRCQPDEILFWVLPLPSSFLSSAGSSSLRS